MLVKVIYLNTSWEYVRNVKKIEMQDGQYILTLSNGFKRKFDSRLRLIVDEYPDRNLEPPKNRYNSFF